MIAEAVDLVAQPRLEADSLVRSLQESQYPDVCDINLSRLEFVSPTGLVAVAALAEAASRDGRHVQFLKPHSLRGATYLSRMGVGDHLRDLGVAHDLPAVTPHPLRGVNALLELRRFDGQDGADELATLIFDLVEPLDSNLADALRVSLDELARNAAEHSTREHGWLAAQTTYQGEHVTFAVGDSGVGLRRTLARYDLESERDALRATLVDGLSSRGTAGGRGLPDTRMQLTGMGGGLVLTSRTTTATCRPSADKPSFKSHPEVPGVIVSGTLPCSHDVWRALSTRSGQLA